MDWVFLSPHFDDAALSCGGMVWEQTRAGSTASIWTICAGDPAGLLLSPFAETLHTRWETGPDATQHRRNEDQESCRRLGAQWHYFSLPDCIYRINEKTREALYASEEAIFGEIDPGEASLVKRLASEMKERFPTHAAIVCPMALGGHVDHRLVRRAAEKLKRRFWYYADYPYVLKESGFLAELAEKGWKSTTFPVSEEGLHTWQSSIAAHRSQISSFWESEEEMRAEIERYCWQEGGIRLWQKPRVQT